jgi:glycosyltransferase involved in cell wall biosynthesis
MAARAIRYLGLDVVHVQFAPSAFDFSRAVGLLPLLLRHGPPVLVTLHEYGVWSAASHLGQMAGSLWATVERRGYMDRETVLLTPRRVQVVVTNTNHAAVMVDRCQSESRRPVEIPIGPNIERVATGRAQARRSLRQRLGVGHEAAVVVFFGFLHPVKDLDRLIRAVASLRAARPDVRLVLIGGAVSHSVQPLQAARLRRQLDEEAMRHGAAANVVLTGYVSVPEVSESLLGADVAVFPFKSGVTLKSGSLLAALSHDLPVIATRPAESAATAGAERGVLWVAPGDTAALAAAIDRVLLDPSLRCRLRRDAAALIERHSWPGIAAAHAQIYENVLARP